MVTRFFAGSFLDKDGKIIYQKFELNSEDELFKILDSAKMKLRSKGSSWGELNYSKYFGNYVLFSDPIGRKNHLYYLNADEEQLSFNMMTKEEIQNLERYRAKILESLSQYDRYQTGIFIIMFIIIGTIGLPIVVIAGIVTLWIMYRKKVSIKKATTATLEERDKFIEDVLSRARGKAHAND